MCLWDSRDSLCDRGFPGWWSPVKKMSGCVDYPDGTNAFIAQTPPWDGAVGGRIDTNLRYTDHRNSKLVQDFFSTTPTVPPILGGCMENSALTADPMVCHIHHPLGWCYYLAIETTSVLAFCISHMMKYPVLNNAYPTSLQLLMVSS